MPKEKALFLIGSPNQTTQMHQIAQLLADDFELYFSQLYYDGWQRGFHKFLLWTGGLNRTIVTASSRRRLMLPWPLTAWADCRRRLKLSQLHKTTTVS